VVAIFFDRIKKGLPLTIFGDGEQTRDFVYVKEVVQANLAAIRMGDQLGWKPRNNIFKRLKETYEYVMQKA
jgi:nucleoside-diphosphate-sugar epimerase